MNYGDGGEIEIIEGLVELLSLSWMSRFGTEISFFFPDRFFRDKGNVLRDENGKCAKPSVSSLRDEKIIYSIPGYSMDFY